jgi:hypothetical protein
VAERVAVGDPVTYVYDKRTVHARVGRRDEPTEDFRGVLIFSFMPYPERHDNAIPISQFDDYEGIKWERGWTDGVALLAAHALAISR